MKEISKELIKVSRDCDAILVPGGEKVILVKGTHVRITQALGGDFTVHVDGNLLKISGKHADAIGMSIKKESIKIDKTDLNTKITEEDAWDIMKTCYDPKIPVNIVDLGLIYDLKINHLEKDTKINIKMTLTAPGCGMGPVIAKDVEDKLMDLPNVSHVLVELVWEPAWNQSMMTETAKLELGML